MDTEGLNLRLYIAGDTLASRLIVENVREACAQYGNSSVHLQVFDVAKDPRMAIDDQIVAIPSIKISSAPGRVFVGNPSSSEGIIRFINSVTK